MVPVETAFAAVNLFTVAHARAFAETYWSDVTHWLRLSNGVKPYCGSRETSASEHGFSECFVSRRRRSFQAVVASPSTRHTRHTLIRFQTSEILPPCPIARGGNTPYHPTEQKRILMGEIISIMDQLFR
jgi:hypothetical protein